MSKARVATSNDAEIGVILWEEREAPERPLLEALLTICCWGPASARAAAAALLERHAPWGADLAPGQAFLLGAASPHQSRLFMEVLKAGEGHTLDAIGRRHGLNGPAVGDAVQRAGRHIRAVLDDAPFPWPWLVRQLGQRLGTVTTTEVLGDVLGQLGAVPGSESALLAAWLAGPFRSVRGHPGWLARDPAALLARSRRCIRAEGGVRRYRDVSDELADLGIVPGMLMAWLEAHGAVIIHELVVDVSGSLADATERLLDAHGAARSVFEIAGELARAGRVVEEDALAAVLRTRRFVTGTDGAIRLAAWGEVLGKSSTSGQHRPHLPPDAEHGQATPRGHRLPEASGLPCATTQAHAGPKARAPSDQGASEPPHLVVRVDDALLRGEEGVVPLELAAALGLHAGERRTFSCRFGPLTMAYEGTQLTRGSLRAVARAIGARAGDTLVLGFSPAGELAVEVRDACLFGDGGD